MIAIVDYGLGNLFSVKKAFDALGVQAEISGDPNFVRRTDRIVLPGIGAFGDGMSVLRKRGLEHALNDAVIRNKTPFLGICLGLQFLADSSEEYGEHRGLGWLRGHVKKINVSSSRLKLPHIGWNAVSIHSGAELFRGIRDNADFYFVHSYQMECKNNDDIVATTEYGEMITAAILHKNIFATQFHPEKSQDNGLKLLQNFASWRP